MRGANVCSDEKDDRRAQNDRSAANNNKHDRTERERECENGEVGRRDGCKNTKNKQSNWRDRPVEHFVCSATRSSEKEPERGREK